MAGFQKRIYSISSFKYAIDDAFTHLDEFRQAARAGRISHAFAERIMLAVTQVNGCRYCDYGHARAALAAGVTEEEIACLRAGDLDKLPEHEFIALTFAQHYAECAGQPDPEAWATLIETYGADTAQDIRAYIRMIMIGNLLGNTFDAFLSRFVGKPAANSTFWQEAGVLGGIFVYIPASMVKRAASRF